MATTILKIAAILCMLPFISFMLMAIGLIPSKRICKFLREHEVVQVVFGIILVIGLLSSFIAVI